MTTIIEHEAHVQEVIDDYLAQGKTWHERSENETYNLIKDIDGILPETTIRSMEAQAHAENKAQWFRGDMVQLIYATTQEAGLRNHRNQPYTFEDICYYVSVRFYAGVMSFNTIKANAIVAKRFNQADRDYYHAEDLPFSHFAYASKRKFAERNPKTGNFLWQDILEYSHTVMLAKRRAPSRRHLETMYEGKVKKVTVYVTGMPPAPVPEDEPVMTPPTHDKIEYVAYQQEREDHEPSLEMMFVQKVSELEQLAGAILVNFPKIAPVLSPAMKALSDVSITLLTKAAVDLERARQEIISDFQVG